MKNDQALLVQQLFDSTSSTFTYLLADRESKIAVLIDPVLEKVDRDLKLIYELGFELRYVLDTHIHADHVTGAGEIRRRLPTVQTVTAKNANITCTSLTVDDNDKIAFGNFYLTVLATPGHTNASMSFACEGMVFTGDTLLIRGCGRTDFQGGSPINLFASVTNKLFTLPRTTIVYPGHDYNGFNSSTIGDEMDFNPRLGGNATVDTFQTIMSQLKLPYPKQIDSALSMNLTCGMPPSHQVHVVEPTELERSLGQNAALIDVRSQAEFESESGFIKGAHRVTLGDGLQKFLESYPKHEGIIFVCQTGIRSQEAAKSAMTLGFTNIASLRGGMKHWNELRLPVTTFENSNWYPMI